MEYAEEPPTAPPRLTHVYRTATRSPRQRLGRPLRPAWRRLRARPATRDLASAPVSPSRLRRSRFGRPLPPTPARLLATASHRPARVPFPPPSGAALPRCPHRRLAG